MSAPTGDMFTCSPRQATGYIMDILEAGLVPLVKGSPGIGKSSIFAQVAKRANLKMIDHRLSTSDPSDLSGLPKLTGDVAQVVPFEEIFPLDTTPIPKGYNGWFIFLDEINAARKETIAAAYKLILNRQTGQRDLHPNALLGAAGNLETDRAIVNQMGTAMQSRFITLVLQVAFNDWLEDVALKNDYDPRIVSFLMENKAFLMDFRPDHNERTFCCPRTWEYMNHLIKGKTNLDGLLPMLTGTITSGVAVSFVQFVKVFDQLTPLKEILAAPDLARLPQDTSSKWATVSSLINEVNDQTFEPISKYINRLTLDFKVLFFRAVMVKTKEKYRRHPAFIDAMVTLNRYLTEVVP